LKVIISSEYVCYVDWNLLSEDGLKLNSYLQTIAYVLRDPTGVLLILNSSLKWFHKLNSNLWTWLEKLSDIAFQNFVCSSLYWSKVVWLAQFSKPFQGIALKVRIQYLALLTMFINCFFYNAQIFFSQTLTCLTSKSLTCHTSGLEGEKLKFLKIFWVKKWRSQ